MLLQEQIDTKGGWVEVELPKDENIIELEIGQEFIGLYVGSKPNPNFKDDLIYNFETDNGNMRMMYGKTNLDKWMKQIGPGTRVRIKRFEDRKVGQPKPMQVFKVWKWEEK